MTSNLYCYQLELLFYPTMLRTINETYLRVCALLHKTDLKIKNPVPGKKIICNLNRHKPQFYLVLISTLLKNILGPVVMDTDHAPHHVTSWYCVVQISVVTIDPATVEAVVQTHSCNVNDINSQLLKKFTVGN